MNKISILCLFIGSILFLLLPPASAKPNPIAAWDIRPAFNRSGQFAFCLMDRAFPDGKKVTLALSPANEINLGVMIPNAGLALGKRYDISLSFPKGGARNIRAEAMSGNELMLRLGADPKWAAMLADNDQFAVGSAASPVTIPLPNIKQALSALHDCVRDNRGQTSASTAAAEKALPEPLKALLLASGLNDIQPLALPDNTGPHPVDFAWMIGPVTGGVREREAPKGKSLTELASLHLSALKAKCNVGFKSSLDAEQKAPGLALRTGTAECHFPDRALFVAILYYLTAANHFTIFTHESAEADKQAALADRDALARTVLSLAQETKDKH